MNTPEEKAKELVQKYWDLICNGCIPINWNKKWNGKDNNLILDKAKNAAMLCVEEIIKVLDGFSYTPTQDYWLKVKHHLSIM